MALPCKIIGLSVRSKFRAGNRGCVQSGNGVNGEKGQNTGSTWPHFKSYCGTTGPETQQNKPETDNTIIDANIALRKIKYM